VFADLGLPDSEERMLKAGIVVELRGSLKSVNLPK
jgi:hypothetical protein